MRIGNSVAAASTRRERRIRNGSAAWRTDLIESEVGFAEASPQAYVIEQAPRQQLDVHFHLNDQFQVIIGGSGRIGHHPVKPFALHYASGHTGYGPLVAGDEGLAYMTLRMKTEHGALYLPDCRSQMLPAEKRNVHAEPMSCASRASPAVLRVMIPPQSNGAAAWRLDLAPGALYSLPVAGNRFYLVMDGSIQLDGESLTKTSCVFVDAGSSFDTAIRAEQAGAQIYILQFDDLASTQGLEKNPSNQAGTVLPLGTCLGDFNR
jgi:hypothetical protein